LDFGLATWSGQFTLSEVAEAGAPISRRLAHSRRLTVSRRLAPFELMADG